MSDREQRGRGRPYHGAMTRPGIALAVLAVLAWLGGCAGDPNSPPPPPPELHELILSDTVATGGAAAAAAVAAQSEDSGSDHVTYVSLTPGTAPVGASATIGVVGGAAPLFMPVRDGGFDPVLLSADVNDSVEVVVRDAGWVPVFQARAAVRAVRPPIVVRTDPPKHKTDVPLNSAIIVVFSEPVAGGTVTAASIRVFRGNTVIPGAVTVLEGTGAVVAFVPNTPFAANTEYRLEVSQGITDLDGEGLQDGTAATFTTGTTSLGLPASIQVLPDSELRMSVGGTYRATTVVRDAAGNQLIAEPVAWSVDPAISDVGVLSVSSTGLLEALGDGFASVIASAGGLSDRLYVFISAQPAASIVVAPTPATVAAGDTIHLTATVRDAGGRLIKNPSLNWTSSDPAIATVVSGGVVAGASPGDVTITAASGTASGTAEVTVGPGAPVATVTLSLDSATLLLQATRRLSAALRDANGSLLLGRPITWTSHDEAVATVDANGLVTAVALGSGAIEATSEGVSDTAVITVVTLSFASVTGGDAHTCGLTPGGVAYCWGLNREGELGNGANGPDVCDVDPDYGDYTCSRSPVAVAGGLTFAALTGGWGHTCGITTSGKPYCWGLNAALGIGTAIGPEDCLANHGAGPEWCARSPVAVAGGLTFSSIATAGSSGHVCALTTNGAAYCWGLNESGQLGDGSTAIQWAPIAVTGGLTFTSLSVGPRNTCGVTTGALAYCWGYNYEGQLGNGSSMPSSVPVAVTGGLTFASLSVGASHTCGVTTGGLAYCWGSNAFGWLGNGSTESSSVPVLVTGGLDFTAVTAGQTHTCGITTSGEPYCWGYNFVGQLGNGSTTSSSVPVLVSGGLAFSSLSAGSSHTCGVTTNGVAYCWGFNGDGQLGTGTQTPSNVPGKVAGQP